MAQTVLRERRQSTGAEARVSYRLTGKPSKAQSAMSSRINPMQSERGSEQTCQTTEGPCIYTGRDTKTAHRGLGITEEQWNTSVRHITATLDKFSVPAKERENC